MPAAQDFFLSCDSMLWGDNFFGQRQQLATGLLLSTPNF